MELSTIDNLSSEIQYLRNKALLVDKILSFYDTETMTFDIPDKWNNTNRMTDEMLKSIPKSPRHVLNEDISKLLPYSEAESIVNYAELHKKYK